MAKQPYTEAKKAATLRYLGTKERLSIYLDPKEKEQVVHDAQAVGMSTNAYVKWKLLGITPDGSHSQSL